jgi:transposase-like protein
MAKFDLSAIRTDGGTQPRAALDQETVNEYRVAMQDGVEFPPVEIMYDGEHYWLVDGFHRVKAAHLAGLARINANVTGGTRAEAVWASFAANKAHGLRRSNADKQRAVEAALKHEKGAKLSNRQLADHVGVDEKTVRIWREKLEATAEIPQTEKRLGADGRMRPAGQAVVANQPHPPSPLPVDGEGE